MHFPLPVRGQSILMWAERLRAWARPLANITGSGGVQVTRSAAAIVIHGGAVMNWTGYAEAGGRYFYDSGSVDPLTPGDTTIDHREGSETALWVVVEKGTGTDAYTVFMTAAARPSGVPANQQWFRIAGTCGDIHSTL